MNRIHLVSPDQESNQKGALRCEPGRVIRSECGLWFSLIKEGYLLADRLDLTDCKNCQRIYGIHFFSDYELVAGPHDRPFIDYDDGILFFELLVTMNGFGPERDSASISLMSYLAQIFGMKSLSDAMNRLLRP